jgi:beta-ribofuranosylaminobenzene 5'-phosphate synthase
MISVRAPSRLHFGLLSIPLDKSWPNQEGIRRFGGVGLMVQEPGVTVKIRGAADWSAQGPLAERALAFARRFAADLSPRPSPKRGRELPSLAGKGDRESGFRPQHIHVEHCAPEHAGLGTGTQLGLAVARALQEAWGLPLPEPSERDPLARRIGRGARSALGVHGFFEGGFLVEAGKRTGDSLAPLITRAAFPESWRIVLILPPGRPGLHGLEESEAFQKLHGMSQEKTDRLCRLVLLGLLPALAEKDWKGFGEALHEFNALAGETFAGIQGGVYAGEAVAEIVRHIRQQGIAGAGQSSWGPCVFAVAADEDQAYRLARNIQGKFPFGPSNVFVTPASNQGAVIW